MKLIEEKLRRWLDSGQAIKFYSLYAWKQLRLRVLEESHWECQQCKEEGRLSPAETVHHVQELKDRPDLALERANLRPLCHECHDKAHGRIKYDSRRKQSFFTEERY
jgi:5-methylcytosine-specific restriction endonuclease McrA